MLQIKVRPRIAVSIIAVSLLITTAILTVVLYSAARSVAEYDRDSKNAGESMWNFHVWN